MSGIALSLALDAADALSGFDRLQALGADPAGQLNLIGAALEDSTLERFETNIAPDGTPWKPSERATAQNGQTLVDTSRLRDSIGYEVTGNELTLGTNVIYAAIHQGGGKAGRNLAVELPARPYLGVSDSDQLTIDDIYGAAIIGAWGSL